MGKWLGWRSMVAGAAVVVAAAILPPGFAGSPPPNVTAGLRKGGKVTGKVTSARTGAGLGGMCVTLLTEPNRTGGAPYGAVTQGDGTYSITAVPGQSYHALIRDCADP